MSTYTTKTMTAFISTFLFFMGAISPADTAEPSPYGICAHVSRSSDHALAAEEFKLMRRAGIRWARTDFDWTSVQKRQGGDWDYSMFDATVDLAEKAGITILPILDYDVPWASPAYQHLDLWLEYVRKTVTRYQDRLRYWEVWNEQDLVGFWKETPNPANYTTLLKATYQEIKKIDPDLQVLLGGVSGIPYEYIEGIYQAGGANYFDAMAVHPYRYPDTPEAHSLKGDLEKLKALMSQYGDPNKPVWITEIGWPTHQVPASLLTDVIRCGLKTVAPERTNWTLAVFDDPGYPVQNNFSQTQLESMLPGKGRIVRMDYKQVGELNPEVHQAFLWPPEEAFAVDLFETIESYVRRGGIIIFTRGVPLYYMAEQKEDGSWTRDGADESYRRRLHIGWQAWWTNPAVPKEIAQLTAPESFASEIDLSGESIPAQRFLTDAAIGPQDRFIPLLQARDGDFTGTAAALYDLNSDLKGAVIVSVLMQDMRGVSEDRQAAMLPRTYLITLQSGVQRVFWYNLRAGEGNPFYNEDHFGIVHKDLKPKPAWRAMRTLSKARPASAVPLDGRWQSGTVFYPGWKCPDGKTAFALWTSSTARTVTISFEGTLIEAYDVFGKTIDIQSQNGHLQVELSATPLYLIGPEEIELQSF